MLSMPPDNTISAEPALMMSCASMVAFMPEPQTLLMGVAPVASGSFAPAGAGGGAVGVVDFVASRALPRGGLALPCGKHVAHEDLVDALRRKFGALQRG